MKSFAEHLKENMTFVYDAEASKNRVTTHASGGKNREMTAQEYAAYAHDRDKVQAAVKALQEILR